MNVTFRTTTDKIFHVATIERVPDPQPTGTTRRAVCGACGWRGPERGTMELAADDALGHERAHGVRIGIPFELVP